VTEVDAKAARLARLAAARGLGGVVLTRQPGFAWLTGGQTNRIDGSTDAGAGALAIARDGRRFVIADAIEMPRLEREALAGLGFQPLEYAWRKTHATPATPYDIARAHLGGPLGADGPAPECTDVSEDIAAAQTPLTDEEIARYRVLGREAALAVERLCGSLQQGVSEELVANRVNARLAEIGARAIVTLVGADDRIAQFRHPVPTSRIWTETLLVGICAERSGLVVALSRMMSAGRVGQELLDRTGAAASVFDALLSATRPGTSAAALFSTAASAYAAVGFAGEEHRHHQGGAIGYRSRDWIAHPDAKATVSDRQAFAWNPSITGTKIEDTAVLVDGGVELITATGEWPTIPVGAFRAAAILER
jgi:Xaa-Pro aminopeptidase